MAEGIVYLDVDDEITSAAQRIRSAPGTKVALVVPYGSRIATSRMNFRLLSREAVISNRRLSIVSGDAAARSLAASAGLPVYGTVPEYESALARPAGEAGTGDEPASAGDPSGLIDPAALAGSGLAASATVAAAGLPGPPVEPRPGRKSQRPKRPAPDVAAATLGLDEAGAAGLSGAPGRVPTMGEATNDGIADELAWTDAAAARPGGRSRAPVIAAIGVIGLAVVVLAVAAYLFLPSASIALTPRRDAIGPLTLTVSADPDATEVDPVNSVVPALRLDVPVEASRTFTTTGTKVDETAARGSVTFTNYDTSSGTSIPSGSIVSTEGGTAFRTQSTVVLQPAGIIPFSPSSDSVAVTATRPGEGGNVPANTIRVVPQGQNPDLLKVNNPAPTSGGTHTVTPQVSKAEVDKAMAALQVDLANAFDAAITAGAGAPPNTTLFPETATLPTATPDVDPKTLVGKAVDTFDLRIAAHGTVIAVDPRPVTDLARAQLDAQVARDHRLLPDSVVIEVGAGTVGEDGQVTFQATASATQVAIVDANVLRDLVKGKTAAEARAALVPYGAATVTLWPDWASTVTSVDARLTVTIDDASGVVGPGASAAPSSSPRRTSVPAGSGRAGSPSTGPASGPPASGAGDGSSAP
jgi:hypothetical protein